MRKLRPQTLKLAELRGALALWPGPGPSGGESLCPGTAGVPSPSVSCFCFQSLCLLYFLCLGSCLRMSPSCILHGAGSVSTLLGPGGQQSVLALAELCHLGVADEMGPGESGPTVWTEVQGVTGFPWTTGGSYVGDSWVCRV